MQLHWRSLRSASTARWLPSAPLRPQRPPDNRRPACAGLNSGDSRDPSWRARCCHASAHAALLTVRCPFLSLPPRAPDPPPSPNRSPAPCQTPPSPWAPSSCPPCVEAVADNGRRPEGGCCSGARGRCRKVQLRGCAYCTTDKSCVTIIRLCRLPVQSPYLSSAHVLWRWPLVV